MVYGARRSARCRFKRLGASRVPGSGFENPVECGCIFNLKGEFSISSLAIPFNVW